MPATRTWLDDLADWLGVGGASGANIDPSAIFLGRIPDDPTATLSIYPHPEGSLSYTQDVLDVSTESPRVHFVAVAPTYTEAHALATRAYRGMARLINRTLGPTPGTFYLKARPLSPPFNNGRDELDRPLIAFDCDVEKRA